MAFLWLCVLLLHFGMLSMACDMLKQKSEYFYGLSGLVGF
jgi:hypothetical protein